MTVVDPSAVSIGLGAAIVAAHQVAIRGPGVREDFKVAATLAGLAGLSERLSAFAGSTVVVEPTGGTWLALGHAVESSGCHFALVKNTDSARLRKAIAGANKTDVIDAEMLAQCQAVLGVRRTSLPSPAVWGLRRAMLRRHRCMVEAHRAECRLWSLAMWAFPDVWRACGGHQLAQPVLGRWPELAGLARAHLDSIAEIVSSRSRDRDPRRRAERIRDEARGGCCSGRTGWTWTCWPGRWARSSTTSTSPIAAKAQRPPKRSRSGPARGPMICSPPCPASDRSARRRRGRGGLTPSCPHPSRPPRSSVSTRRTGSPGWPRRRRGRSPRRDRRRCAWPTTKRNVARRHDPGLAAHYRKLMVERHHNHISANTAVARKLACRAWAVLDSGQPYHLRDLDGSPLDADQAKAICATLAVPTDVRQRTRAHQQHGRLSPN